MSPPCHLTNGVDGRTATVPIPSDRDRAEPVETPLLRLTPPLGDTPTAPTKLDALGDAAEFSSLIPTCVINMLTGSENSRLSRRATPQCVTSPSAGRRPCHPTFCRATLRTSVPPFRTCWNWLVKDDCTRLTTTPSYSSVTRHRRRGHLTSIALWDELLAC